MSRIDEEQTVGRPRHGGIAGSERTAPADPTTAGRGHRTRREMFAAAGALVVGAATVSFVSGCGGGGGATQNPLAAPDENVKKAVSDAVKGGRVQVGGAVFLTDVGVVITRPGASTYHAFSTVCTHQGGRVDQVNQRGHLVCPLHGSEFDIATGQPVVGPASAALPGATVDSSGAIRA